MTDRAADAPCAECDECAKQANSDATTPGFFHNKCPKHRAADEKPPFKVIERSYGYEITSVDGTIVLKFYKPDVTARGAQKVCDALKAAFAQGAESRTPELIARCRSWMLLNLTSYSQALFDSFVSDVFRDARGRQSRDEGAKK